jgi:predicted nucleic acid-binding protein
MGSEAIATDERLAIGDGRGGDPQVVAADQEDWMLLGVVDEVFPIERGDVERAKKVLDGVLDLSARDALHVAVMRRRGVVRS